VVPQCLRRGQLRRTNREAVDLDGAFAVAGYGRVAREPG
jgi:hypothetical protein